MKYILRLKELFSFSTFWYNFIGMGPYYHRIITIEHGMSIRLFSMIKIFYCLFVY